MIKHRCNDVVLPKLPEEPTLPFSVILNTGQNHDLKSELPIYAILFSEQPFLYYEGMIIFFTDCVYKCYQAITEGTTWVLSSLSVEGGSGNLAAVPAGSTYVWCNEDIPLYPDMTVWYPGSAVVEVDGADEPTVLTLPEYQYTFIKGIAPSQSLPCTAMSLDGGTISYSWRKLVNNKDGGVVSTSAFFTPPTDQIGETTYYCCVTNTKNNTKTSIYARSTIVKVIEIKYDYTSLVQGWFIGKRIMGQRKKASSNSSTINYNLSDFGGYYYSKIVDSNHTYAYFDAGNFPLQIATEHSLSKESQAIRQSENIYLNNLSLKAGQKIKIEALFPAVSFGELIYEYHDFSYSFDGGAFSPASYVYYNQSNSGKLEFTKSSLLGSIIIDHSLEAINNAEGQIIGFKLFGTLAEDLTNVNISCYSSSFSNTKPFSFTGTMNFSSFNDLKISVYE